MKKRLATDRQVEALTRLGYDKSNPALLTLEEAGDELKAIVTAPGSATQRQIAYLTHLGFDSDASALSLADAHEEITKILNERKAQREEEKRQKQATRSNRKRRRKRKSKQADLGGGNRDRPQLKIVGGA